MNPIESFLEHAKKQPEQLAVVSADYRTTFGELAQQVLHIASSLRRSGIIKGQVIGVNLRPAVEIVFNLALLTLGATSLTSAPNIVKAYGRKIDHLISSEIQIGFDPSKQIIVDEKFFGSLSLTSPLAEIGQLNGEDPVRIVFSSGTTGTPKGVVFSAKNLIARTDSARLNWMPIDPFMSLLGLDTVTGMQTFFWHMFHGKTYFSPGNAASSWSLIQEFDIKSIKTSPAKLADLVRIDDVSVSKSPLEVIQVAGSLVTAKLGSACKAKFGLEPTYLYGSTEVGTVTRGLYREVEPNNLGKPVDDVEFEIVDADNISVAAGVVGSIRYRKAGIPKSYWLTDQAPTSAFRDGWFYPGDQGFLNANGELVLKGRIDDLVNAGGQKFNLLELDLWLQDSGLFDDVASFQCEDEFGETQIGVAFVSSKPPIPELLTEQLSAVLPNLQLATLMRLDVIPRNKLGKTVRNELVILSNRLT